MQPEWTEEQLAVFEHDPSRPARILAGPGTGKSATMVEFIGRVLKRNPEKRLRLLTFTRAATSELAEKIEGHQEAQALRPSTVHSFAISVLMQNPGVAEFPQPLRMADDWESTEIVNPTLAHRIKVHGRKIGDLFREHAANWEALGQRLNPAVDPKDRASFLAGWQEHRRVLGYTLLSELPWSLLKGLQNHQNLRGTDVDLVVVDEYQDLNACDLAMLMLLAERAGSVIVAIGDDDQSIYSFRRADPAGIRRFRSDFPKAINYPLSITHRCGRTIMQWASNVIRKDTGRDATKPVPAPSEKSSDGEVALLAFGNERQEAEGIASIVDKLLSHEGLKPQEVLILLRGDRHGQFSKPIKEALRKRGIPFADPEEIKEELAQPENRRFLAYARLLTNPEDSLAWATLWHLTDGVGDVFFNWAYDEAQKSGKQFGAIIKERLGDGFAGAPSTSAACFLKEAKNATAWVDAHPLPEAMPEGGWGAWLVNLDGQLKIGEVLKATLLSLDEDDSARNTFAGYLNQIAPVSKDRAQSLGDRVRIMTMSASKGLTVRATIVAGAEEGIIPSRREGVDTNEECRLLYVAMTRAKQFLFATWARRRGGSTGYSGSGSGHQLHNYSSFFEGAGVPSQDGNVFLRSRWPAKD